MRGWRTVNQASRSANMAVRIIPIGAAAEAPAPASEIVLKHTPASGAVPHGSRATLGGKFLLVGQEKLYVRPKEIRSEEHTSELQSRQYLVCRLLLEKKKLNP